MWAPVHDPDQGEKEKAFEEGFVELGRMPANRSSARCFEYHAPRDISGASIQFAIDEVTESAKP